MLRCEVCRERLIDSLYGLLDLAEEVEVAAHLSTCTACATAKAEAVTAQGLFARAAKVSFPEVHFQPPSEVARPAPRPLRDRITAWAVAAAVLLAIGIGSFTGRDWAAYQTLKPTVQAELAALNAEPVEPDTKPRDAAKATVAAAQKTHDAIIREWVTADVADRSARTFTIDVSGPVSATPGAANEYRVTTKTAAHIDAVLQDARGTVYWKQTLATTDAPAKLKLPATLWEKLPVGANDLELRIVATADATGEKAELAEPIRLLAPVYSTFLVTDKPMYQPGEPVFFRSLTLDRTRFLPPTADQTLRVNIRDPKGQSLPNATLTGLTLRGVSCGTFALPAELPGGEYTLIATELPLGWSSDLPPTGAPVVGIRKFLVNRYTPEKLQKRLEFSAVSFGVGDVVSAMVTVKDGGRPLPKARLSIQVSAGKIGLPLDPNTLPSMTDVNGSAIIRFTLPPGADVRLSVTVGGEFPESIVRKVPVATKQLNVELFPEGGDLVAGLPNRVYFRATTKLGRPADIIGHLHDGTRNVADLQTMTDVEQPGANQGLGVFTFTPEAGKTYTVKLLKPHGVDAVPFDLKTKADGTLLRIAQGVVDANDPIRVAITSTRNRTLFVGAYTRGVAIAQQQVKAEAGKPIDVILTPVAGSPGGVTRVTVLDESEGTPLAERLMFRRPKSQLILNFKANGNLFAPGDRAKLDISATNETGAATAAILWAAVVNESVATMADDKMDRLLPTYFLLNGEVQKPELLEHSDFFLTSHPKAAIALDLLLGTQGWRRFAEQTGRFQSTADVEPFRISNGMKPRWLRGGTLVDDTVSVRYLPQFDPASKALDEATANYRNVLLATEEARKVSANARAATATDFATNSSQLTYYRDAIQTRTPWVAGVLAMIGALAIVRGSRAIRLGGFAFVALAVVLIAMFANTRGDTGTATSIEPKPVAVPEPIPEPRDGRWMLESASKTATHMPKPSNRIASNDDPFALTRDAIPAKGVRFANGFTADEALGITRVNATSVEKIIRGQRAAITPPEFDAAKRVAKALTRSAPFVVREYAHAKPVAPIGDDTRTDFTETVYWHPMLVLPEDGKGRVEFQLSDALNPYRVLIAGHTLDGRLGSVTGLIEVRKPLAVDIKLPLEISATDRLIVPVSIANGTATAMNVKLTAWSDHLPILVAEAERTIAVNAMSAVRTNVTLKPTIASGMAKLRLAVRAGTLGDSLERTTIIVPDGFPVAGTTNAILKQNAIAKLSQPAQIVPGSLRGKITVYANAMADVQSGLSGLLREPNGCFEQTSAANYPNVLALDTLRESGKSDPAMADLAKGMLERGYAKLTSFEVPKKTDGREGFEWFGKAPAHEPLTAFGLMQLADMSRVYPVEQTLIDRTRSFLLSRRDGRGGFQRSADNHSFGAVPEAVANAYIVWAITEADRIGGKPTPLEIELTATFSEAMKSNDPYRLALVANALMNRSDPRGDVARKALASLQNADGALPAAETTITRSSGIDLITEATALAALAWLKPPMTFAANATNATAWLNTKRTPFGAFGATQATVLTLKALVEKARQKNAAPEKGVMIVRVADRIVAKQPFDTASNEPIAVEFSDEIFGGGAKEIRLETTATAAYPFNVAWTARAMKPESFLASPIKLTTSLSQFEAKEGQTISLRVRVENTTATEHGMAIAIVGIPAGLKLPADMKRLRELRGIDYWEQRGRELILYWRGLKPMQNIELNFDVIADVSGEFRGPASRAYLYYQPESQNWQDPLAIRILP